MAFALFLLKTMDLKKFEFNYAYGLCDKPYSLYKFLNILTLHTNVYIMQEFILNSETHNQNN